MSDNPKTIVWVHGDCMSPHNPALVSSPNAPAIFVWDEALLNEWHISFKRIVFMYECLLELPVTIRRGDVVSEIVAFAKEHGATCILTAESPSPRFRNICRQVSQVMPSGSRLEVLKIEPFVDYAGTIDLKRFSRYWSAVKESVLR